MLALGKAPTKAALDEGWARVDTDGSGLIEFGEWTRLQRRIPQIMRTNTDMPNFTIDEFYAWYQEMSHTGKSPKE